MDFFGILYWFDVLRSRQLGHQTHREDYCLSVGNFKETISPHAAENACEMKKGWSHKEAAEEGNLPEGKRLGLRKRPGDEKLSHTPNGD